MLVRALAIRAFALVWAGQTISRVGDGVYTIALAWWVLEHTGSAAAMGAVLVVEVVPTLLLLLVGGVVVDRLPRLRLMVVADVVRGTVVVIVAGLALTARLELWHVFIATALFGSVSAFAYPALFAAVPDLVPRDDLSSANALLQLGTRMAGIIGPGLGAALVAVLGSGAAFALDGASFLLSGVAIAVALPLVAHDRPSSTHERGVLLQLRAGIAAVLGMPWLWVTIGVAALSTVTLAGPLEAALPFLVSRSLGAGVEVLGMLGSVSAAGAIAAAAIVGRRKRLRHRGPFLYAAWLVAALMVLLMGLPIGVVGVACAMTIAGAALASLGLVWSDSLQELVPRELRGRVSSIDQLGSSSLLPVGFAVTGIATDQLGASAVFVLGGLLSLVIIGAGLLHPQVRGLD